ncbi:MAG: hypothetical protein M3Q56_08550 [Bacteroidota bacterium]|nr:hypothetical protein [Bacteroidota bacterium]
MRTLLKFSLDVDLANEAIKSGKLPVILDKLMELTKPEAAYFSTIEGTRTGLIFFDMKESSEIPPIAELLFVNFEADVEFFPVMNKDELQKGLMNFIKG